MKRLILLILSVIVFTGCTTTKYVDVPVETVKKEYITQVQKDSIYMHDSIFTLIKGDTILSTKYRYIYKYINSKDTVHITDSVPKIVTVTKTLEVKSVDKWQETMALIGEVCTLILIISFFIVAYNKLRGK